MLGKIYSSLFKKQMKRIVFAMALIACFTSFTHAQNVRIITDTTNIEEILIDEVGKDFAELLEAAKTTEGRVVRPFPIHKIGSFMERARDCFIYVSRR